MPGLLCAWAVLMREGFRRLKSPSCQLLCIFHFMPMRRLKHRSLGTSRRDGPVGSVVRAPSTEIPGGMMRTALQTRIQFDRRDSWPDRSLSWRSRAGFKRAESDPLSATMQLTTVSENDSLILTAPSRPRMSRCICYEFMDGQSGTPASLRFQRQSVG